MENREAIEYINLMRDKFITDKPLEACDLAISALEKQIPRPVRIEYDRRHNYFLHFCPVCGDLAREYKYCSDCGQKLSYEEEAEEEDAQI